MITTLHLGLSYACNLNCEHCYVQRKKDVLSVEQYKQLIRQLCDRGLMVIMYTYGEPLLSGKLHEVAEYASSLGISQIILTNGWFLTEETVRRLEKCGISSYNISLDSPCEAIHDSNRGQVGAWYRAVEVLRLLVRLGKDVGIGYTLTEHSVGGMKDILRLAQDEGISRISFLAQRSNGLLVGPLREEYLTMFRRAITGDTGNVRCFFHDYRLIAELDRLYRLTGLDEDEYSYWYQMNTCHAPYTVSVEPNGDMYRCNMCPEHVHSLVDGNICRAIDELIGEKYESFICRPLLS